MRQFWFVFWFVLASLSSVKGDVTASYTEGANRAHEMQRDALRKSTLNETTARDKISNYTRAARVNAQTATSHDYASMMKDVVRTQLSCDRPRMDPNTDPIFVNANRAVSTPEETLRKQTTRYLDEKDYEERSCIDTRDDEFEVVNTAHIDPYYERYEVWQFYNHCPNTPSHCGWGKRNDCPNYQQNHSILKPTRRPEADYEEIHGMEWIEDKHPEFDSLLSSGKCRLKKEMPKEEGRESRMIPVVFYKKEEVSDRRDWTISKIDDHRIGRSRLKRPEDFGVESFVNIQVFMCSYQTPGNTCQSLRAQGGIEMTSHCSERMSGVCVKWRKRYNVPKRFARQKTTITDLSQGYKAPFNVDGRMNDKRYVENREAPEVLAKLTALHDVGAALPKIDTGDPNALSVFRGDDNRCVSQAGNNRCPGGHGNKEAGDLALERKWNDGKCIRVGTYDEKNKNIGQRIGQKRTVTTFCCFESILSKVLHQGAISQGIKALGDPKTPNCSALTLGQLQRLNWDRVDFTPFVVEMTARVNLNAGHIAQKSSVTVQSHLSHQMTAAASTRMREQAEASRARGGGGVS